MPTVRSRRARWCELRDLLAKIDNLVIHNAQIDSGGDSLHKRVEEIAAFEADLENVKRAVQREIVKLTVDRLNADHKEKLEVERR